jgi:hypothetical protein
MLGCPMSVELAAIAAEFPRWHPWKSTAGRRWATRLGDINPLDRSRPSEWSMCVDADTADGLRNVLTAQEALERRW